MAKQVENIEVTIDAEGLIAEQNELLASLRKLIRNYKKDSPSRKTESYFQTRLLSFEGYHREFRENHRSLVRMAKNSAVKANYLDAELGDVFEEEYSLAVCLIKEDENNLRASTNIAGEVQPPNTTGNEREQQAKNPPLPELQLPVFNGDYIQWYAFKEVYLTRVHDNKCLTDLQRFYYLKSALGKEAASDIEHLSLVGVNYSIAWNMITKIYENKRVLFTHYMDMLSKSELPAKDDSSTLRRYIQTCRSCVTSIEKLGVQMGESKEILVYYLLKGLPNSMRIGWERDLRKQQHIPTFSEFCTYLEEHHQMMVTSQGTSSNQGAKGHHKGEQSTTRKDAKAFSITREKPTCVLCTKEKHCMWECSVFKGMTIQERRNVVKKYNLCFNCLGVKHTAAKCNSQRKCLECGGRHHTLIHQQQNKEPNDAEHKAEDDVTETKQCSSTLITQYDVLLPTALIKVSDANGNYNTLRTFLDQGSQASFISERAAQMLGLPRERAAVNVHGLANKRVAQSKYGIFLEFGSIYSRAVAHKVFAYVLPKVGGIMPESRLASSIWTHLEELKLADPHFYKPRGVDILLGNDIYDELIRDDLKRSEVEGPIAQLTSLGYIVSGKCCNQTSPKMTVSTMCNELRDELQRFWELEEIPSQPTASDQDQWCETFYRKTHRRLPDGKYIVQLPILTELDSALVIGASRNIAYKRFLQLERRLLTDIQLRQHYQATIQEYLDLGQMKRVNTSEDAHKLQHEGKMHFSCCYLPHHPVVKESSTTTKVRIVFDASTKTQNGKSLNDILATGPTLHTDLIGGFISWRCFAYAFTADMKKMYRCIAMDERCAQYQRILWRNNPQDPLEELYCNTVMFGTRSAPYTALRTVQQLAEDEGSKYPLAVDTLKKHVYVDDVLSGCHSLEEACEVQSQVTALLSLGAFNLRKWASNDERILKAIPAQTREETAILHFNGNKSVKTLGMLWNTKADTLGFSLNFEMTSVANTKRSIFSFIAKLFDPLGLINPVVIKGKIIMQSLWAANLQWDEPIPVKIQREWEGYVDKIKEISEISIPRWVGTVKENSNHQLHIFCDASAAAYSAVAYIRTSDQKSSYRTSLLIAKCKLSPLQAKLTIPRAELAAAVLAIRLVNHVKQHLTFTIDQENTFFWTDSMIVLGWIRGDRNKWKIYVANRLQHIANASQIHQWRHVGTKDNPADISTRGMNAGKLKMSSLCWHGPDWLKLESNRWPQNEVCSTLPEYEMIARTHLCTTKTDYLTQFIERSSSYDTIVRIFAYCYRFIYNCRKQQSLRKMGTLTVEESQGGLMAIIRIVQINEFNQEYANLSLEKELSPQSSLKALNPIFDIDKRVIRLGGRLRHSMLPENRKHPYILPSKHHFSDLVIRHMHIITMHGGVSLTLSQLRNSFWILNGRSRVRSLIHRCITCYRNKPKIHQHLMGDLPAARVRPARAFSAVGVDYAGPISISPSKGRGRTSIKGYIALFICLVSKAVHLEAVGDLSSEAFLGAMQRFIGRRGLCRDIYSDQGTNFIGADRKLQENREAYAQFIQQNANFLSNRGIQWHFNPPSAPHFGGLWEAGIKSIKYHLKRTIGTRVLTFEELTTVLVRIESCLNSRPLCPLTNDPDDLSVLTPGHFLIGDSLLAPPEPEIDKESLSNRWKNCQFMAQQFWRQWSKEYLARLQRRPKWMHRKENLKVNDIVLIRDERLPCNRWALGRIISTHAGMDGVVRVATLKTSNGVLQRPTSKLCPLPISNYDGEPTNSY